MARHCAARAGTRRMIPAQNIVAWGNVVPWADQRQVEQDLIISRALVEIFSDQMLRDALRFRGGTALKKLHFPAPLRYSEDIDLVRTSAGPIGPILDQLRVVLEPRPGRARFVQRPVAPKFRFRVEAENGSGVPRGPRPAGSPVGPSAARRLRPCPRPACRTDPGTEQSVVSWSPSLKSLRRAENVCGNQRFSTRGLLCFPGAGSVVNCPGWRRAI